MDMYIFMVMIHLLLGLWEEARLSYGSLSNGYSLYISFIRYEGLKGAGTGSGGFYFEEGLDASFNNVDISNNLNIIHNDLETRILPEFYIYYSSSR